MQIKDVLDEKLVCVLKSKVKKSAIFELIGLLKSSGKAEDMGKIEKNIFHREALMSTGIGLGIAVPHTRMEGITAPLMAVGVSSSGIADYESIDGEKVRIIFLVIAGSKQHKEYISLLSDIVKKLKEKDSREKLSSSGSGAEVYRLLCNLQ